MRHALYSHSSRSFFSKPAVSYVLGEYLEVVERLYHNMQKCRIPFWIRSWVQYGIIVPLDPDRRCRSLLAVRNRLQDAGRRLQQATCRLSPCHLVTQHPICNTFYVVHFSQRSAWYETNR